MAEIPPPSKTYEQTLQDLIEVTRRKAQAEARLADQLARLETLDEIKRTLDGVYRCVYEMLQIMYAQAGADKARLRELMDELAGRGMNEPGRGGINVHGKSVDVNVKGDMVGGDQDE